MFQWLVRKFPRHVASCATKPLNYQQVDNLLLQIMVNRKKMVMLLFKKKTLNLLKPSPVIIISKHRKILSQNDTSKAEITCLLKCVMSGCSLFFNDNPGDTLS